MQVIYGPNAASNILLTSQKRLIRPTYAQTQGFPYAASLDPSLRNADGSIRVPLTGDTAGAGTPVQPFTRTGTAFTSQGSLIPGLVMTHTNSEQVAVASGNTTEQPMGLLGQWVGGTFDNVGQSSQVGIWMGPDSTYTLLAPAWNDTGLAAAIAAAGTAGTGVQILLYVGTDGRLIYLSSPGGRVPVARVLNRVSASHLVIQLLI